MILFLKSYVRAHNRTLSDGTVVPVSAHHTKTTAGIAAKDDRTPDMFKPPITAANRPTPLPLDAAKHPEKYTPDMFTGETAAQTQSHKPPELMDLAEATVALHLDGSPLSARDVWLHAVGAAIQAGRPIDSSALIIDDALRAKAVAAGYQRQGGVWIRPHDFALIAVDKTKVSPLMIMRQNDPTT